MATPRLLTIVLAILIIAVGAGLTIYWFRRPVPSDRQQVMDVFLQMQRAAERKSLSGVMRHIADDYDDGTYTRRDLMRLGVSAFREPEPFNIVATVRSLEVTGSEAVAMVEVWFSVGAASARTGQHVTVQVQLQKNQGRWQVTSAQGWQDAAKAF